VTRSSIPRLIHLRGPATEGVAEFLAVVITQLAVRDFPERPAGSGKSPLLTIALMHIEGNLGDHDLSLESLAATVGTSPRTLHREFHAIGMTPMGALRDARLAAVAQRLSSRAPLPPLEALAQEYGYSDRTALTRAFHRRFGRSPSDYRARMVPFGL
jgi:AraC-like DNA-binding protein